MTTSAVEGFLETADPAWQPVVRDLDRLIRAVGPALNARVAYRMLVYSLDTDKARWVVAIDARTDRVVVRFLWGVLLDVPCGVLRGGTSTLMNLDLTSPDALEPALVTDLVAQAVSRYPDFKARDAARAAGT